MDVDQGHTYFMVLFGKPYKKCIWHFTFALSWPSNVCIHASFIHFTIQLLTYSVGGYDVFDVLSLIFGQWISLLWDPYSRVNYYQMLDVC